MNATTRTEHPPFLPSAERVGEHRPLSGWTVIAIVGLVFALLAMAVQPAYQHDLSSSEEVPSLLE
jgi:hypothetical protein